MIRTQFAAAHNLRRYRGQCERLHGHNWQVEIYLQSVGKKELTRSGMVIDFKEAKKNINEVLNKFDHRYLNELKEFSPKGRNFNPTTENLARLLYEQVEGRLKSKKIKVSRVCVWESASCGACYYKNKEIKNTN
ncbi:MAG: 6-carboxytetrahydropterin synthase QueD [Planctomycetota bacterium]